jgi:quinol monooxygenase YgiN
MTIPLRSRLLCLVASLWAGCAGTTAETGVSSTTTTPAAAVGEPVAELSPEGARVTSLPPPEPEEPPEPNVQTPLTMFGAALIFKVKDFAAWKDSFDADLDARKEAGFAAQGITRAVDNERRIMVWLAVTDVSKAKAFFADKLLRARMKEAGVEGKPEIHLWSNVDAKMDPGQRDLSAALVIARVKDVASFKPAFQATEQARADAGIAGYSLSEDVDDKGTAYLYLQSQDPTKLKVYLDAKATKQSWRNGGMKGTPAVTLVKEGEMTTYQ